jgi:protein SCO1/2
MCFKQEQATMAATEPSNLKRLRLLLWVLVALAAASLALLWFRPAGDEQPETISLSLGGPFTLTGSDGRPFSSASLAGQPYALFFGFTHCPDVCPTTLARLVRLRRQLAGGDGSLAILFVTVDPERDGPKEVGQYTSLFGAPVIGLTGTPARIGQVKKQFGISSRKSGSGPDYNVDHTAAVLLFDDQGKFTATISHEENDEAALAKLRRLTSG